MPMPACSGANAMGSPRNCAGPTNVPPGRFVPPCHHKMLWLTGPPAPLETHDVPNDVGVITALSFHLCQRRRQREGAGQRPFAKVCTPVSLAWFSEELSTHQVDADDVHHPHHS